MRIAACMGVLALLSACAPAAEPASEPAAPGPVIGMANPASVACAERFGGDLSIIDTPEGQVGMCALPDGRVCEEWELFRENRCAVNRDGPSIGAPVTPKAG